MWGCLIPLGLFAALMPARRFVRRAETAVRAAQFFAGFCLIANGLYVGVGWTGRTGDAGDLLRYGTPVCVLVVLGVVTSSAGLYLWHRLGGDGQRRAD